MVGPRNELRRHGKHGLERMHLKIHKSKVHLICIEIILILENYMVIYNVLQLLNEKGNPPSEFKILRSFRINNQPVKFKKKKSQTNFVSDKNLSANSILVRSSCSEANWR